MINLILGDYSFCKQTIKKKIYNNIYIQKVNLLLITLCYLVVADSFAVCPRSFDLFYMASTTYSTNNKIGVKNNEKVKLS